MPLYAPEWTESLDLSYLDLADRELLVTALSSVSAEIPVVSLHAAGLLAWEAWIATLRHAAAWRLPGQALIAAALAPVFAADYSARVPAHRRRASAADIGGAEASPGLVRAVATIAASTGSSTDGLQAGIHAARLVARLVSDPTTLRQSYLDRKTSRFERLRRLYAVAYDDPVPVLVSLAYQYARSQTLTEVAAISANELKSARRVARDLEKVYVPLAEMLGLWGIGRTIGETCIRLLLDKSEILELDAVCRDVESLRDIWASRVEHLISGSKSLAAAGLIAHPTRAYSLYRRKVAGDSLAEMRKQLVWDVIGQSPGECGRLAMCFAEVTGDSRDWLVSKVDERDLIRAPRFNGYQGIHAGFRVQQINRGGEDAEIIAKFRFLTEEMRQVNAWGILHSSIAGPNQGSGGAAWWHDATTRDRLRESCPTPNPNDDSQWGLGMFTEVEIPEEETHSSELIIESEDTAKTQAADLFVFSPTGQVYNLPVGSNPIDYAFRVHSEVGAHCRRFWVNGRFSKPDRLLRNGDLVEVETDRDYIPSLMAWYDSTRTEAAKEGIELANARGKAARGREIILSEIRLQMKEHRLRTPPRDLLMQLLAEISTYYGYLDLTAMFRDLGSENRRDKVDFPSVRQVASRVVAVRVARQLIDAKDGRTVLPTGVRARLHLPIESEKRFFGKCRVYAEQDHQIYGTWEDGELVLHGPECSRVLDWRLKRGSLTDPGSADYSLVRNVPQPSRLVWRLADFAQASWRVHITADDHAGLVKAVLDAVHAHYAHGLYLIRIAAEAGKQTAPVAWIEMELMGHIDVFEAFQESLAALKHSGLIHEFDIEPLSTQQHIAVRESRVPWERTANGSAAAGIVEKTPEPIVLAFWGTFYGREREVLQIRDWLTIPTQEAASIYSMGRMNIPDVARCLRGVKRIGKTFFMQLLKRDAVLAADVTAVWINLLHLHPGTSDRFWHTVADAMLAQVPFLLPGPAREPGRLEFDRFRDWCLQVVVPKCQLKGCRLLLMFDELNKLNEWDAPEAITVANELRSFIQDYTHRFEATPTGTLRFLLSIHEGTYQKISQQRSRAPLTTVVVEARRPPIILEELDQDSARKMISCQVKMDPGQSDQLISVTNGHPWYLQTMLSHIRDECGYAGSDERVVITGTQNVLSAIYAITPDVTNFEYPKTAMNESGAADAVEALARATARHVDATVAEVSACLAPARGGRWVSAAELEQRLECAVRYHVIQRTGKNPNRYRIRIALFQQYLLQQIP